MTRVAVLGGGISGLVLASKLLRNSSVSEVIVLEKSSRLGGWIHSQRVAPGSFIGFRKEKQKNVPGDGLDLKERFLFERGPHSMKASGRNKAFVFNVLGELGLLSTALPADSSSNIRHLFLDNKLVTIPYSLSTAVGSAVTYKGISAAFREIFYGRKATEDETVDHFFRSRFGDFVAGSMIASMVSGIYAGDSSQLSMESAFPDGFAQSKISRSLVLSLFKAENKKTDYIVDSDNSEINAIKTLEKATGITFKDGLQTLVLSLKSVLQSSDRCEIKLNNRVKSFDVSSNTEANITLESGEVIHADAIFSTLPISSLWNVFPDETLRNVSEKTPYADVVSVNLGYLDREFPLKGFGHLVPGGTGEEVIGTIYDSNAFPSQQPKGSVVLTSMIGGSHSMDSVKKSSEELLDITFSAFQRQLGLPDSWKSPDAVQVTKYRNAIPQAYVGFQKDLKLLESLLKTKYPRLTLLGNNFYGVGIADSIKHATIIAESWKP